MILLVFCHNTQSWQDKTWKHHKYPCFCLLMLEFGGSLMYINMKTVGLYATVTINLKWKCLATPDWKYNIRWFELTGNCTRSGLAKHINCHMTGAIAFWFYVRNGRSDWRETKRKCMGWILGQCQRLTWDGWDMWIDNSWLWLWPLSDHNGVITVTS